MEIIHELYEALDAGDAPKFTEILSAQSDCLPLFLDLRINRFDSIQRRTFLAGVRKNLPKNFLENSNPGNREHANKVAELFLNIYVSALEEEDDIALGLINNAGPQDSEAIGSELDTYGVSLTRSEDFEKAIEVYDLGLEFPNAQSNAYANALWLTQSVNTGLPINPERSRKWLEICLSEPSEDPSLFFNAAGVFVELEESEKVVENIRKALHYVDAIYTFSDFREKAKAPLFDKFRDSVDDIFTKPPPGVHPDAWWSEEDCEWIYGEKDEEDRFQGVVKYWRPGGTLCCQTEHVDGEPNGTFTRFHESGEVSREGRIKGSVLLDFDTSYRSYYFTSEKSIPDQAPAVIHSIETHWAAGRVVRQVMKDIEGTLLTMSGQPLPKRPASVPEGAIATKNGWISGTWNEQGEKDGEYRYYRHDGSLSSIELFKNNIAEGQLSYFDTSSTLLSKFDYVDGKPEGGFYFYHENGKLAQSGEIVGEEWKGSLKNFDREGKEISSREILRPSSSGLDAQLSSKEQEGIDKLGKEVYDIKNISPQALATLIAIGWGGDWERDVKRARAARAAVKGICKDHDELRNVFAEVRLDKAPRVRSIGRLRRFLLALSKIDRVDAQTLTQRFVAEEGPGENAALIAGGAEAVDLLSGYISGEGRLNLSNFGLDAIPEEVIHFPRTSSIDAKNNSLKTIPDTLCDLPLLSTLKLSHNEISSLPASMTRLHYLRSLYLSANELDRIPKVIFELEQLRTLELSNNNLDCVPDEFSRLKNLDTLWLGRNPLRTLPKSFAKLTSLTFLHMVHIEWDGLPDCIWELENLETLWLESRHLVELPAQVSELKNLKKLCVWHSKLASIPDVLFEMTHLEEIRIGNNPLEDGVIERLKEALPDCTIY